MLWRLCLDTALLCSLCVRAEQPPEKMAGDVRLVQALLAAVKESGPKKCHYHPANAHSDFQGGRFEATIREAEASGATAVGAPAMVYNPCMHTYSLGNSLGNYFHEAACALEANISIVYPLKVWDNPHLPLEYKHGKNKGGYSPKDKHDITFFARLPAVLSNQDITHPSHRFYVAYAHADRGDKVALYMKACECGRYCWSDGAAPWLRHHRFIREVITEAVNAHLESALAAGNGQQLTLRLLQPDGGNKNTCDFVEQSHGAPVSELLPLVPDAAIQLRCGDMVPSKDVYGFLPFAAYLQLVPRDSRHIYVLTDPPGRADLLFSHFAFAKNCRGIARALLDYLRRHFPGATVAVKFGGDPFLDYVRLSRARVTICSASTFCLWPAIASNGTAYFPASRLLAGWQRGQRNDSLRFGASFHWLETPALIHSFTDTTTLKEAVEVLTA